MRWPLASWIGAALAALACGCRTCDRVESELRARETDVRELREELDRSQAYNHALETELHAVRGEPIGAPGLEHPVAVYPVRSLALGRQTGGRESEAGPGDDALQVVLEPRDPDNQAIKVPGSVLITTLEITPAGLKKPLSTWEITPEQLARSWRTGLLSTGYSLVLPWKVPPSTTRLRVIAQFRLSDGRVFEADKDVTVRLPSPSQVRPMVPVPTPEKQETVPPMNPVPAPPPEKLQTPAPLLPAPTPTGPALPEPAKYRPPAGLGIPTPKVIPVRMERPLPN